MLAVGAGATAYAVDEGVLPGRSWVYRHLGPSGEAGVVPDVAPGPTVNGFFRSEARLGRRVGWTLALPPDADDDLPLTVVLHGRGGDHTTAFAREGLGLDRFLAAHVRAGGTPFALASVDGGETYWHARDSGEDAGAMVTEELLPRLAREGVDTGRLAFLGWSMGGYGGLLLAGRLGPDRVAAVTAASPALWHDYDDTSPGAFDSVEDFAEAGVMGRQTSLDGIAVRVDCGEGDPFYAATRDYVDGFARPVAGGFEPGGHDRDYWRRIAPDQLEFLGRAFGT